jgi:demethylmenaquinone methyltransferase/2-methoxy-6-polyprenyl-1,4-benzoquinol methylase
MREGDNKNLLEDQMSYYRARAPEYDEWFLRKGRYDRGPVLNKRWFDEAAAVRAALDKRLPETSVLEIACGTGLWTRQLAGRARQVTAVDASPEMIEINRRRVQSDSVKYVISDIYQCLLGNRGICPCSGRDSLLYRLPLQ